MMTRYHTLHVLLRDFSLDISLFLEQTRSSFHLSDCCHLIVLSCVTCQTCTYFFSLRSYHANNPHCRSCTNCFFSLTAYLTKRSPSSHFLQPQASGTHCVVFQRRVISHRTGRISERWEVVEMWAIHAIYVE
jgi:hypothetical protein